MSWSILPKKWVRERERERVLVSARKSRLGPLYWAVAALGSCGPGLVESTMSTAICGSVVESTISVAISLYINQEFVSSKKKKPKNL